MNLFQWGAFRLHSGRETPFKIDCEALTPADWRTLSNLALEGLPPFSRAEGVPMGGLTLAAFLSPHSKPAGTLMIVDDVFTTGSSMERQRAGREARGLVVFARSPTPDWITPLFRIEFDV